MARPATAAVRLLSGEHEPVRVATTANTTMDGLLTVDGVALSVGDRVLVKDQADARTNGIYTASAGLWRRAPDARTSRALAIGATFYIQEGATYAGQTWRSASDRPNIGDDDIEFVLYLAENLGEAATQAVGQALTASIDQIGGIVSGLVGAVYVPFLTSQTPAERSSLLNATLEAAAFSRKVIIPNHPDGPGVEWEIETEGLMPSGTYLTGESWCGTGLKLSDTALATQNVLTNILNDRTEKTEVNSYIVVEGLRLNGNGSRSGDAIGTVGGNTAGCGIGLAGVEVAIVTGNKIYGGFKKHCIDVAGSIYNLGQGGTTGDDDYPTGPSSFVSILHNDCLDAADDAITTHSCTEVNVLYNRCGKVWTSTLDADNSNLIEIDEGTVRALVFGNTLTGGVKSARGVEVKGHSDTPAARDVVVAANRISGVCVGVCIRHLSHGNGAEPQSPTGFNVVVRDNTIFDIGASAVALSVSPSAVQVQSYEGVLIEGNVCENLNDTFPNSPSGAASDYEVIYAFSGAKNLTIQDNTIRGFKKARYGIRVTSGSRNGHRVLNNDIIDSGYYRAISLSPSELVVGGNNISFADTGLLAAGAAALAVSSMASLVEKRPNRVSGYGIHMTVNGIDIGAVEPFYASPKFVFATAAGKNVMISSGGSVLVGPNLENATDFTSTWDGFQAEQDGTVRISRDGNTAVGIRRRSSDGSLVNFWRSTSNVGSISVTTTATAYNTSSDHRLKEQVSEFSDAAPVIDALRPVSFTWKATGDRDVGFIAHEVQAIVPTAVNGSKDLTDASGAPVYQGGDWSKLVPFLIAEVKALRARVASLEGESE